MVLQAGSTLNSGARISVDETEIRSKIDHAIGEERLRISRDLHDHTAQQATILKLRLQKAKSSSAKSQFVQEIDQAIADVDRLIGTLHDIVDDLRHSSWEDNGFLSLLRDYTNEWSNNYDIPVEIVAETPDINMRYQVARALLNVAREALINVKNHALNVSHVIVTLQCTNDDITLTIDDDGVGFDIPSPAKLDEQARGRCFGLVGMRERLALIGGHIEITSERGSGTRIRARIAMEGRSI